MTEFDLQLRDDNNDALLAADGSPIVAEFPSVVDSTMMATADACPQKFFTEYVLRLTPTTYSPDLMAGGAIAQALETFRKAFYTKSSETFQQYDESLELAHVDFIRYWGDYEPPLDRDGNTHQKDFVNTWMALESYFKEYPPLTDTLQPYFASPDSPPAVEFTFSMPTSIPHPISGDPIIYAGRCDMIAQVHNGPVVINDEKTTKNFDYAWSSKFNLRGQYIGYTYAAQLHGFPVTGAITRGIAIQKTQFKHMQAWVTYQQWQIDRWWITIQNRLQQLVNYYQQWLDGGTRNPSAPGPHAYFPLSYADACTSFGGCQFTGLCESEFPADWYGTYQRRVWNPLDKNPTEGEKPKEVPTSKDPLEFDLSELGAL